MSLGGQIFWTTDMRTCLCIHMFFPSNTYSWHVLPRISQQKPKHNEKQLLNLMWWYDRELTNTHVLFQYYLHSMGRNCRSSSAMVLFLSFLLRYDSVICYLLNNDKAIMDDRERKKSKEKKRRKNCSTMTIRYLYAIW